MPDDGYITALLAGIAHTHFPELHDRGFKTLDAKGRDRLDFIEAPVWKIREALEEAYSCGHADAMKERDA